MIEWLLMGVGNLIFGNWEWVWKRTIGVALLPNGETKSPRI